MAKRIAPIPRIVRCRIAVVNPPAGVAFAMQRGRGELIAPSRSTADRISFDFTLRLGPPLPSGLPNFLGEFAQGTPDDRFVYVNSGQRGGQHDSCWNRRAKIKLAGIGVPLLKKALALPDATLEAEIAGTARDGGPACATVPILGNGWHLDQ
ncbi:MAG: hypothetical protein QOC81_4061 [Thermoanaerobaculia bacterium]|jgi:hypothetical protein|nr:hypothetical protein [Thermoanaerobaculia bacterium]